MAQSPHCLTANRPRLATLPTEILVEILNFLDEIQRAICRLVSLSRDEPRASTSHLSSRYVRDSSISLVTMPASTTLLSWLRRDVLMDIPSTLRAQEFD